MRCTVNINSTLTITTKAHFQTFLLWFNSSIEHTRDRVTVDSRYIELRYTEFCVTQSVHLNQKYILITFSFGVGDFLISPIYPKFKLVCTSGNLNLLKIVSITSRYRELNVY